MGQTEQQSGSNLAEACFAADRSGNLAFRAEGIKIGKKLQNRKAVGQNYCIVNKVPG